MLGRAPSESAEHRLRPTAVGEPLCQLPCQEESSMPVTIAQALEAARARLRRLDPQEARRAQRDGAVLVDIRPHAQRATSGHIPGALVIERNVLEWRFDPESDARLP